MQTYTIFRRSGWTTPEGLQAAAERSRLAGEEMPEQVRWIRSYVLVEDDGRMGTVCVYQATGPAALREHARRADLPADDIVTVADTLILQEDPLVTV